MSEFLEEEQRRKIYTLLIHNPGLDAERIAALLHMKRSEVEDHLRFFEEHGIVRVTKAASYVQYFIKNGKKKPRDKRSRETRKQIFDLLVQNPGLHLSKIAEMLDMSIPLTDYHLSYMERNRELVAIKDERGYYKRYYIAFIGVGRYEKKVLAILRNKIPLKIVLLLLNFGNLQHKAILKHLDIASSTLSYHLSNLVKSGIVAVSSHGEERGYTLINREELIKVLKKHELHIELHVMLEGFKDLWDDLNY
jgi:predicted transcriptional regulator